MSKKNAEVFPAPGEAVSLRWKVLERGSGEVPEQGSGGSVGFLGAGGKLCARAEKPGSRRRGKVTFIHYRRTISRFSWRWGKLCPGAGKAVSRRERSHSFSVEEKRVGFPGAGGSCNPAPGKLLLAPRGAGESCVPAPGKLFLGVGERLAGHRLV